MELVPGNRAVVANLLCQNYANLPREPFTYIYAIHFLPVRKYPFVNQKSETDFFCHSQKYTSPIANSRVILCQVPQLVLACQEGKKIKNPLVPKKPATWIC